MGRNGGKRPPKKARTLARDFKDGRKDEWRAGTGSAKPAVPYAQSSHSLQSAAFEAYYAAQGVVPAGEWEAFLACARTILPSTFRINGEGAFAAHIRDKLRSDFVTAIAAIRPADEGETVQPPFALPWCAARRGAAQGLRVGESEPHLASS